MMIALRVARSEGVLVEESERLATLSAGQVVDALLALTGDVAEIKASQVKKADLAIVERELANVAGDVKVIQSNYVTKEDLYKEALVIRENCATNAALAAVERDLATVKTDLATVAGDVKIIKQNYVTKEHLQKEMRKLTLTLTSIISGIAIALFSASFYALTHLK